MVACGHLLSSCGQPLLFLKRAQGDGKALVSSSACVAMQYPKIQTFSHSYDMSMTCGEVPRFGTHFFNPSLYIVGAGCLNSADSDQK